MEQYIKKSEIVAEIERKIHNIDYEGLSDRNIGQKQSLYHILSFLDTLEVKEVQEEPVSEDLEEAADNALNKVLNNHEIVNIRSCLEMFKYGAQWKEKKSNLP